MPNKKRLIWELTQHLDEDLTSLNMIAIHMKPGQVTHEIERIKAVIEENLSKAIDTALEETKVERRSREGKPHYSTMPDGMTMELMDRAFNFAVTKQESKRKEFIRE